MTNQEYENVSVTSFQWNNSLGKDQNGHLQIKLDDVWISWDLYELLIPMYRAGFIEGYIDGMFVVQKIDNPGETELVDVDAFMVQNVDMIFCESIIKYL